MYDNGLKVNDINSIADIGEMNSLEKFPFSIAILKSFAATRKIIF